MDTYQRHLKERRDKDTIHAIGSAILSFGLVSIIGTFGLKIMDYKPRNNNNSWFYNRPAITRPVYRNNTRHVGIDLNLNGTIEAEEWLRSQPKSHYEPNN